jgi:hypothetical protein
MRKFVCGVVGALTALTIFGTASANILEGIGNAAEDVAQGAHDAIVGVADGGESLVEGVVDTVDDVNNEIIDKEGHAINEVQGDIHENENDDNIQPRGDINPTTGSVEIVTFGLAAGSLVAVVASRKKR